MSSIFSNPNLQHSHTDELQDIITKVPSWLLRWGITLFFIILVLIIGLAAIIRYPDLVKTSLKIESPNSSKPVVAKTAGKLIKLLAQDNQNVAAGQVLGYIESTADHAEVLRLLTSLKLLQSRMIQSHSEINLYLNGVENHLGELQTAYQAFYQEYLIYKASIDNGFYLKKRIFLQKDLIDLNKQQSQLTAQKSIQAKDFRLAEEEYNMHHKLELEKVETPAELRQEESKFLAKKSPLIQTESSLITNNNSYSSKQREILELDNQLIQERSKFLQALNSLISQAEEWKNKFVLSASQAGKLTYTGTLQENQVLTSGQEVFYINPGNERFFGEMSIPQNSMGKVKEGQRVLIKLRSYPFEEYGMLNGRVNYIADIPFKDSVFFSKVSFNIKSMHGLKKPIRLKQGMMADAEIITQDATILQRITRSLVKVINNK